MHLKYYLRTRKISQKEFSKLLEVSENTLSSYIRGHSVPTLPIAFRIIQITNGRVTIKDLLSNEMEEKEFA